MKRGTKIGLIIALILALSGVALCAAAAAMGVTYVEFVDMVNNGDFAFEFKEKVIRSYDSGAQEVKKATKSSGANILEVDLDAGELSVLPSDSDEISFDAEGYEKYFEWKIDGDQIIVKNTDRNAWIHTDTPKATLYVPENMSFDEIDIDVDAGKCSMALAAVCDKLILDVDAGSVNVSSLQAEQAEIECDAGSVFFEGKVINNGAVSVNAGSAEIGLKDRDVMDYNYDISVGAGSIEINEKKYSGLASEDYINNHADADWTLECNAGKIEMKINK